MGLNVKYLYAPPVASIEPFLPNNLEINNAYKVYNIRLWYIKSGT
jgi:hypothetical protein